MTGQRSAEEVLAAIHGLLGPEVGHGGPLIDLALAMVRECNFDPDDRKFDDSGEEILHAAEQRLESWGAATRVDERSLARARRILNGIDKTESESGEGWWETSTGAEFGAKKLDQIEGLIREVTAR